MNYRAMLASCKRISRHAAVLEGFFARRDGEPAYNNPYGLSCSAERKAWREGWSIRDRGPFYV
ncbi:MAG: hypothetical protein KGO96_13685 [Elusimicrobia bacterium]|nr:hypothetical protein [Elusimicrobiota bacterium]MDE2236260.1 hypothetical protein [Elusimicrobiota bacterium]MDE2426946.1 hypothetical protein [Elusimicrobiota bacterium]